MLLSTIRWLLGYAVFEVKGGFPEQFINLAVKNDIHLWDVKKSNGDLTGKVIAKDYKELRHSAKKANSKVKVKQKRGLPFFIFKHKKRSGILFGAILFLAVLSFFSFYIWSVDVSGNESIPTAEILKVMSELGVSSGSLKSRINAKMVQQNAMIRLTDIAWMSVNIHGGHVDISIKEKIKAPDIIKQGAPCNIVASKDGQIERMETYNGTLAIKSGDVVTEGQILISGVVENLSGQNSFVHAEGKIFAKTRRLITERIKLNQLQCTDTGKVVKRYRIKVFGLEIPFNSWHQIDDTYRSEFYSNTLQVGEVKLPITIFKEEWHEQECSDLFLTVEEAFDQIQNVISEREKAEFEGIQIIDKAVENREEGEECIREVTYICVEDIGKKEEIIFE